MFFRWCSLLRGLFVECGTISLSGLIIKLESRTKRVKIEEPPCNLSYEVVWY